MTDIKIRKGMPDVQINKELFAKRFRDRFFDPDFDAANDEIAKVIDLAWVAYDEYHKNPRKTLGGKEFSDPTRLPLPDSRATAHSQSRQCQVPDRDYFPRSRWSTESPEFEVTLTREDIRPHLNRSHDARARRAFPLTESSRLRLFRPDENVRDASWTHRGFQDFE